jgi:hypothetical protein
MRRGVIRPSSTREFTVNCPTKQSARLVSGAALVRQARNARRVYSLFRHCLFAVLASVLIKCGLGILQMLLCVLKCHLGIIQQDHLVLLA